MPAGDALIGQRKPTAASAQAKRRKDRVVRCHSTAKNTDGNVRPDGEAWHRAGSGAARRTPGVRRSEPPRGVLASASRVDEPVIAAIRFHHDPDTEPTAAIACVQLANASTRWTVPSSA